MFIKDLKKRTFMDNKRCEIHTFKADAVTGGAITTQIRNVEYVALKNNTTANAGTFVVAGNTITISGLTAGDIGSVLVVGT